jgi:hypothetical protein
MGISNVAVKTFDSSGAQSLCRTSEYKGDEEVKSSFISKCEKMYISGSGETVIPGSLRSFPTTNSTDTFYVNSDTDAISDITLNIEFKLKRPSGNSDWHAFVSKDIILGLIDKVEIKIGNLVVQKLTADDIYIRNLSEFGQPFTFSAPPARSGPTVAGGEITNAEVYQLPASDRNVLQFDAEGNDIIVIQAACSIPFIGRSSDMSRSLLQAGALTNSMIVKVHYNNIYSDNSTVGSSHYQVLSAGDSFTSTNFLDLTYFKSFVAVRTHIITQTEKNFISKNVIHKVLNTSSNVTKEITKNTTTDAYSDEITEIEVDLEDVSINVSHLLIGLRLPHVNNKKLSVIDTITAAPNTYTLNETGFNEISTPFSVINSQTFFKPVNGPPDNLFGYMPNAVESMELVLGSDRTGFIKGASAKIGTCENFTLVNNDKNSAHYIITLAEKAFDTSGIAFSKINNKKLLIRLNNYIFKNTSAVTPNPLSSNNYTQNAIITVTACGTKVQTVVGGSMSFM